MNATSDFEALARRMAAAQRELDQHEAARRERQRETLRARHAAPESDQVAEAAAQAEGERLVALAFPWHLLSAPTLKLITETKNAQRKSLQRKLGVQWAACCLLGIPPDGRDPSSYNTFDEIIRVLAKCPFPSAITMTEPILEFYVHEVLVTRPDLDGDVFRQEVRERAKREMENRREIIADLRQQGLDIINIGEGWWTFPSDEELLRKN